MCQTLCFAVRIQINHIFQTDTAPFGIVQTGFHRHNDPFLQGCRFPGRQTGRLVDIHADTMTETVEKSEIAPVVAAGVVAKKILTDATLLDDTPFTGVDARIVELGGIVSEHSRGASLPEAWQEAIDKAIERDRERQLKNQD